MKATLLLMAIMLTKAHRAVVSIIAEGYTVVRVLPLSGFLFYCPIHHLYAIIIHHFAYIDKRGILQQKYFKPPILTQEGEFT